MPRAFILFLALLPGLARAGAMQAPASSSDAVDRAEAALMDGDFERASSLVARASGPEAARILGEALEAQGDLKGAASGLRRGGPGLRSGQRLAAEREPSLAAAVAAAAASQRRSPTSMPSGASATADVHPDPHRGPDASKLPRQFPPAQVHCRGDHPVPTPEPSAQTHSN